MVAPRLQRVLAVACASLLGASSVAEAKVSPELLVGNWDCEGDNLQTIPVLENIEKAGGIEALGDAGSAEWDALLDETRTSFSVNPAVSLRITAFLWVDEAETEAFFINNYRFPFGSGEASQIRIGSVSLSTTGDWVIQTVNEGSNGVSTYTLLDEDSLSYSFIQAGTLTAEGEPAFSEVRGRLQTPTVGFDRCTRQS